MNETDAAWAAGFFEGEGCVRLASRRTALTEGGLREYASLYVDACQVNKEPLDRLMTLVGGRIHGPYKYGTNKQPHFKWVLQEEKKVLDFFDGIKPFLSTRRCEQFENAITAFRKLRNRPRLKTGPKPRENS